VYVAEHSRWGQVHVLFLGGQGDARLDRVASLWNRKNPTHVTVCVCVVY